MTDLGPLRLAVLAATLTLATTATAQQAPKDTTTPPAAAESTQQPLASGMAEGSFRADLIQASRNGDVVTIKVRYAPTDSANGAKQLYDSVGDQQYNEELYMVAGGKKYLLLKDSAGKPLATPQLKLSHSSGDIAGVWYGDFPAPPADVTSAMVYISGTEPLGPFEIK